MPNPELIALLNELKPSVQVPCESCKPPIDPDADTTSRGVVGYWCEGCTDQFGKDTDGLLPDGDLA